MGNICRSPTAKGFFDLHCKKRGLMDHYYSESAGTHGWHVGQPPDSRSIAAASGWGTDISGDLSRQVDGTDFERFHYIIAMDSSNLEHLKAYDPGHGNARISLLLPFNENSDRTDVPDPYYGGAGGFEQVCKLIDSACSAFLDQLEAKRLALPAQ
jgi:protein-tyrosine phosphatase